MSHKFTWLLGWSTCLFCVLLSGGAVADQLTTVTTPSTPTTCSTKADTLPVATKLATKYDPRQLHQTTPIQNQGALNLCWAYTANDVIALSLGKQQATTYQFSANYYNYLLATNAFSDVRNPLAQDRTLDSSGDDSLAEYLAFLGYTPVRQQCFKTPRLADQDVTVASSKLIKLGQAGIKADIQAVYTIAGQQTASEAIIKHRTALIKSDVKHYGAVSVAINANKTFDYLKRTHPQYSQKLSNGQVTTFIPIQALSKLPINYDNGWKQLTFDHQLTIVGWDDNYSKNNFMQKPHHNGAFLVKNTWGTSVLEKGYAWMSYEDLDLLQSDLHSVKTGRYVANHQYRQVNGATNAFTTLRKAPYTFIATRYRTGAKASKLTRFGVYTTQNNVPYQLYVTTRRLNTQHVTSLKGFTLVSRGTLRRAGLQKINIKKPYSLAKKQAFTLVLRFNNSAQRHYILPVQLASYRQVVNYPYVTRGTSYLSQTTRHLQWQNYSKNYHVNFYLLGYTQTTP